MKRVVRSAPTAVTAALLAAALVAGCSGVVGGSPQAVNTTTTTTASATATRAAAAPVRPSTPARASSAATHPATSRAAGPRPNGCAGNTAPQLVRVNVTQQHLWMCAGTRTVRETPVTTGMVGEDTHTPTGTYVVQGKVAGTTLTLLSGATYEVQYWIPFDGPLFGFHDSSWQDFPYGSPRYRTEGSHGCVHVPLAAIRFLYSWAEVGAAVRIET